MYEEMSHHKESHLGAHCDVPFVHPFIPRIFIYRSLYTRCASQCRGYNSKIFCGEGGIAVDPRRGFGTFAPESCPLQVSESLPGNSGAFSSPEDLYFTSEKTETTVVK